MNVEGHQPKRHGPSEVEQHLDDPVDAVDLFEEHVGVLPPPRLVAELALQKLDRTSDCAQRVPDLVGEADRDLARCRQRLAPAHLGFELMEPRDVAHDRDRGRHRATASGQRGSDDAHVDGPAVRHLHQRLGFRPTFSRGQRVAQMSNERRRGGKDVLEGAPEDAARGAAEQGLGGGVPKRDAQAFVDADDSVREPRQERLVVEPHHGAFSPLRQEPDRARRSW